MSADGVRERVQAVVDGLVASGAEVGLQVAVVERGRVASQEPPDGPAP